MNQSTRSGLARVRIQELADQCVACGLCLPHCPTYLLAQNEAESPRGRLQLAKALSSGALAPTTDVLQHLDQCLACGNCQSVCPAQVQYLPMLDLLRAEFPTAPSRHADLLSWLLRRPRVLGVLAACWRVARKGSGIERLTRHFGLHFLLGAAVRSAPRHADSQPEVLLLAGCANSALEPAAVAGALALARAAGLRVQALDGCCGAFDLHRGRSTIAQAAGQKLQAQLMQTDQPLLGLTPGCHDQQRALFGARYQDFGVWLSGRLGSLKFRPGAPRRVLLHWPCTLRNQARGVSAWRACLAAVSGPTYLELPGNPGCCGAAGSYQVEQPELSRTLGLNMLGAIDALRPDLVLSCNIGCLLQLRGLTTHHAWRVQHPAHYLAEHLENS